MAYLHQELHVHINEGNGTWAWGLKHQHPHAGFHPRSITKAHPDLAVTPIQRRGEGETSPDSAR